MKRIATLAMTGLLLTVGAARAFAADSIGTVDYDRLVRSYNKAQAFSEDMKTKETELEKIRNDYVKQIRDTKAKSPNNPVAVDQLQKKLEDQLNAKVETFRTQEEGQAKVIEAEMNAAIEGAAKSKSLSVVLAKQTVFLGGTDITTDVLSRLNASSASPAKK
jgi:Skp family chaperone for outer membrane proteins